ncbi:hypothetical protein D3C75_1148600 [compost metagenome]
MAFSVLYRKCGSIWDDSALISVLRLASSLALTSRISFLISSSIRLNCMPTWDTSSPYSLWNRASRSLFFTRAISF